MRRILSPDASFGPGMSGSLSPVRRPSGFRGGACANDDPIKNIRMPKRHRRPDDRLALSWTRIATSPRGKRRSVRTLHPNRSVRRLSPAPNSCLYQDRASLGSRHPSSRMEYRRRRSSSPRLHAPVASNASLFAGVMQGSTRLGPRRRGRRGAGADRGWWFADRRRGNGRWWQPRRRGEPDEPRARRRSGPKRHGRRPS